MLVITFISLLLFVGLVASKNTLAAHPACFLFLLLFLLSILTVAKSPDPLQSLSFSLYFLFAALCSVLLPTAMKNFSRHSLAALLTLPLSLACIYALLQIIQFHQLTPLPFSFYFNPNIFAGLLILATPLFFQKMMESTAPGWRFRFFLALVLALIALFMTQSRGAILSLAIALLAVLPRYRLVLIFHLVLISFLLLFFFIHPKGREKWTAWETGKDRSMLFRILVYKSSLKGIAENPLGYAAFSFRHIYPRIKLGGVSTLMAHNTYLQMALELGLPGLFLFLWICFYLLGKKSWPVQAGLLSFAFHNMVDYTFYFPSHLLLLLYLVSMDSCEEKQTLSLPYARTRHLIAPAVVLLLTTLFLYQANHLLELAEDRASSKEYKASFALLSQMPYQSLSLRALKLLAEDALRLGKYEEAKDFLNRARQLAPQDPEVLFPLGISFLKSGHEERAIPFFEEARKLQPSGLGILRELALTYLKMGKMQKAKKTFQILLKTAEHPYQSERYAPLPGMIQTEKFIQEAKLLLQGIAAFEKEHYGEKNRKP